MRALKELVNAIDALFALGFRQVGPREKAIAERLEKAADAGREALEKDPLMTALKELEGFAMRNLERARKAYTVQYDLVDGCHERGVQPSEDLKKQLIESEARLHEAQRVKDVVVARVAEAFR